MKPRVLIFIDWFSPGYKAGGPTTSNVNIVAHLKNLFDFYVITSDTDYHSTSPYPNISTDCWSDRDGCHVWYVPSRGNLQASIRRAAAEAACDVWYVNGIYSRYFSIYPLLLAKRMHPHRLILSPRGMLSPQTFTVKPMQKKIFLKLMRLAGLYHHAQLHGTNLDECRYAQHHLGKNKVCFAIPNLPRKLTLPFSPSTKPDSKLRLVSFARISPEKNTLYAITSLRECKQTVEYDIYGQINSKPYWEECQKMIASLPANLKVTYKGVAEPTQMPQLYREYDALFLPTTGENFGHAILECFMNSRPAIISDTTPWRDLAAKGIGVDLALDNIIGFSKAIDSLAASSRESHEDNCRSAYLFAENVCNNEEILQNYCKMFDISDSAVNSINS